MTLLEPGDHPINSVMAQVGADLFKRLGLTVDDQAMDAATMFQRRSNRGDLAHGGWSCFPSAVGGIALLNPAVSFLARGNGREAWYGWSDDPEVERLRLSWFEAGDLASQQATAAAIQTQILQEAPCLPLGRVSPICGRALPRSGRCGRRDTSERKGGLDHAEQTARLRRDPRRHLSQ